MDVVQTYTFIDPSIAAPMVAGAPEGWRTTLDKLEKQVVRMQGGTETGVRSVAHAIFHLERTYDAPVARVWKALTVNRRRMLTPDRRPILTPFLWWLRVARRRCAKPLRSAAHRRRALSRDGIRPGF
jgi:hypothetical protein